MQLQSKARAWRTPCSIIFRPIISQTVSSASLTGRLLENQAFLGHLAWCLNQQVGVVTLLPSWYWLLFLMPYERGKEWAKTTPLLPLRRYLLFIANTSDFLSRILLILPVPDLLVVADVIETSRMRMAKMPLIPEDWWLVFITLQLYREFQRLIRRIHLPQNSDVNVTVTLLL